MTGRSDDLQAIKLQPEALWDIWASLDVASKVRGGTIKLDPIPRYFDNELSQMIRVRLNNGWLLGIAHRWRDRPQHEWSLPDPKRIYLADVALFCA